MGSQDNESNNIIDEEIYSLKEIINLMPGNIFWKKGEVYLGCNNNLAHFLGLASPEEFIGKTNYDLMPADQAKRLDLNDQKIMNMGHEISVEEVGVNIHNEPILFLSKKIPLKNKKGEVTGILGISMDISERKKMEEELRIAKEKAQASNRAKSDFLAVINHELRTPLTSMIGLVDILKKGDLLEEEEKTIIDNLKNCTELLLGLVNDILDFSKLKAGKQGLAMKSVNLKEIINDLFSILSVLAKNKNLNLISTIDPDVPKWIITDPRVMNHILINLINNAIKFTEAGTVGIHIKKIKMLNTSPTKIKLEIAISDSGEGIPSEHLDKIFEPFQQIQDAYVRRSSQSGTGLGLTIVKRLADLLDMEIRIASEIGKGSTFFLTGDFEMDMDTEKKSLPAKRTTEIILEHRLKILLIEDDQMIQFIHKKMLTDLNCEVDIASTGAQALELLGNHDIVFVDLSLPDMTGFDIIKFIRRQESANRKYSIIALTAYTSNEEEIASIEAGANEFATKPISQSELKKVLERHLQLV